MLANDSLSLPVFIPVEAVAATILFNAGPHRVAIGVYTWLHTCKRNLAGSCKGVSIVRSVLTYALTMMLLAAPIKAGQLSPTEQAGKIRPGAKIEVVLLTGEKLNGRLGKVSEKEFDLLPQDKKTATSRVVSFAEVQRLHSKERRTGTRIAIYPAATLGVLMLVGAIVGSRV